MWSQYDEDLSQNSFFKEIKENHPDILQKAAVQSWIICIPKKGSLKSEEICTDSLLDHILIPTKTSHYSTLSKKEITIINNTIIPRKDKIFYNKVEILFEETHYIENAKYMVWCINSPLFDTQSCKCSNKTVIIGTIQDCIDFLYSETYGHNLLEEIRKLCEEFLNEHEKLVQCETVQVQKEYIGNLYSQCLELCFKNDLIKLKCKEINDYSHLDNFKLSIETYMQYCLGKQLIFSINSAQFYEDCLFNKILRNSCANINLINLNISKEYQDVIHEAQFQLSRINNFVTILDKVNCLLKIFQLFECSNKKSEKTLLLLTSDDFLQILVYLILNSNIPNWISNLIYLKEFNFSTLNSTNNISFLITSLEAALTFIKSTQFIELNETALKLKIEQEFPEIYLKLKSTLNNSKENFEEILMNQFKIDCNKERCHPLCLCLKCKKIQNSNKNPYNNIVNNFNQNLIIMATIENNSNFLEFLLSLNLNANFKDNFGKCALHYAAEKGYQKILLLLINFNVDVNILDNQRNTALHAACDKGHENCVKALIYSSHFVEINLQNIAGETPLFLATKWSFVEIIKILLENGASVCIKNNRNMNIYQLSTNYYVSKVFNEFGRKQSRKIREEVAKDAQIVNNNNNEDILNISRKISRKEGLSFGTVPKNNLEMKKIELLLKVIERNDVPLTCYYLGYNVTNNLNEIIPEKFEKCHPLCNCTKCNNNINNEELTQIDDVVAIEKNTKNLLKFNVNLCNKDGITALHNAAKFGRTEILRILLDEGALINARSYKMFFSPLHFATISQQIHVIKELLQCGNCEIDAKDSKGNTPLFYACCTSTTTTTIGENLKIVEILLKHGANCQIKNLENKSVLQMCEEKNLFNVCRLLKDNLGLNNENAFSSRDFEIF